MVREIVIDEEFKSILPALDEKTYAFLEESLLAHGCMHPLVLWGDILIDGHNRYEICTKHDIPFSTVGKEFETRDDVLVWIIHTQVSRRNLNPIQLAYFRGLHYHADKRLVGNIGGRNQHSEELRHNDIIPNAGSTVSRLAGEYNVSPSTITRDALVATAINAIGASSPDAKRSILDGSSGITRRQLQELAVGQGEGVAEVAGRIEDGSFERGRGAAAPAADFAPELEKGAINRAPTEFVQFANVVGFLRRLDCAHFGYTAMFSSGA